MYKITNAEFRRMTDYNGQRCAEIEVSSGKAGEHDLLVYVAKTPQGAYDIVHMYSTDIDPEIDWYNNNLHNSYEEISEEEFGASLSSATQTSEFHRMQFKDTLFGMKQIAAKLQENL
ncbi:hypothetical protein AWM70_13865 [Paenibacillus yonginensis]|uniref:Uncharacterized protein n=1 Tax=Paenibacillus yonginensis TaxID=1462996 RepID=A0A1B1N2A4_9BACL|nr:hypothetical protein [Paenibacillus yonginensis]ANS75549.1 hypothetical protein AWM70_13865 [Paenibacillus yonginensis]